MFFFVEVDYKDEEDLGGCLWVFQTVFFVGLHARDFADEDDSGNEDSDDFDELV